MSSISADDAYHARLRARVREYQDILASSNPPTMIVDSPARRGHILPGNAPYMHDQVFGGKRKTGFAKALKEVGQFVKPLGKTLKPIKHALMERAVYELGKPMYAPRAPAYAEYADHEIPEAMVAGKSKGRHGLKKFLHNAGEFLKPVAKYAAPIAEAASARAVREIGGKKKKGFFGALKTIGQAVKPLGRYTSPVMEALSARAVREVGGNQNHKDWHAEVAAMREAMAAAENRVVSYKEAMVAASEARKAQGIMPKKTAIRRTAEQLAISKLKRDKKKSEKKSAAAAAALEEITGEVGSGRYRY